MTQNIKYGVLHLHANTLSINQSHVNLGLQHVYVEI